ncbi:hypothetical protein AYO43_00685 [Nitrospira sp. SCGC AG-212-E16]|nr:hypothetical protein AYO43_00685 [Nitrospira sp. SCGC AG-212-E16]
MCAMVSLLGSNAVFAQEAELRAPLVKKEAESLWQTLGFKISGATDVTYTQNFNNPSNNVNNMRIFDTQANSFVPQVAQLVFEKPTSAGSAYDRVGFRARLSWGAQARFSRARTNYQPGNDNAEFDPQEIYGEYLAPIGNGLKIQVGKIHTLVGLEQINSWDNYNISRTFMFGLSQAFTTTGIRFTYPINKYATVAMGLVNGWDNIEDNNRGKTFEWGVFLTPHDRLSATFYGTYGAEQGNGNNIGGFAAAGACVQGTTGCDPTAKRLVAGAIITVKVTDKDTLVFEPYYANESNASAANFAAGRAPNARWNGIGTYYIHDFNDQMQPHAFSYRLRGEVWEDAGGARSCGGGANVNGAPNVCVNQPPTNPATAPGGFFPTGAGVFNGATGGGEIQTVWEVTNTIQYKPAPSLITRMEVRHDHSNSPVFMNGTVATNNQTTLGFQVMYLF